MKFLSLIAFPFLLGLGFHEDRNDPKRVFYFCHSRIASPDNSPNKTYIFYTGIRELENDSALLRKRTNEWYELNKKGYKTTQGWNNLNTYFTQEDAQKQLQNILYGYADTGKYTVIKIDF